ncbi:hypothetical protein M405DRAFT_829223 [Rhizopogon salebrosus TDB-379]|nr:hypothetical protein M405DRAFT_829223 [Rhizopogon salebrosus TDB-379]
MILLVQGFVAGAHCARRPMLDITIDGVEGGGCCADRSSIIIREYHLSVKDHGYGNAMYDMVPSIASSLSLCDPVMPI